MDKSIIGNTMLGVKLKELRESKSLLQRQVAAVLGVDTAYVSKIENNEKPISDENLEKLAKLFDFPLSELFKIKLADKFDKLIDKDPEALDAFFIASKNNGSIKNKYIISRSGKGENIMYHLLNATSFDMVDMFFSSSADAEKYALKMGYNIVKTTY